MQVKYLQLNAWRGGERFDQMVEFIKSEKPDIMAMQEIYGGTDPKLTKQFRTIDILKKEFKHYSSVFAPAFLDNRSVGKIESGNAVLSKFPIKQSQVLFYQEKYREVSEEKDFADYANRAVFMSYPRNLQNVEIDLGKTNLSVINTHGVWGFDAEDNEKRLQMSEKIVSQIKGKKNVILSGDFNVKENTKTIGNLENHLKNVFKGELETTFNLKVINRPGFTPEVVDFIFVSADLKVADHYCPDADISDHLPLICILEI